jgi:hypothetical protein
MTTITAIISVPITGHRVPRLLPLIVIAITTTAPPDRIGGLVAIGASL